MSKFETSNGQDIPLPLERIDESLSYIADNNQFNTNERLSAFVAINPNVSIESSFNLFP